jgi:hypothetical protein
MTHLNDGGKDESEREVDEKVEGSGVGDFMQILPMNEIMN